MLLLLLLSIPRPALAQGGSDNREKFEKVSEILAALQAEPGKRIADVGAGEGFSHSASLEPLDPRGGSRQSM
jgi:hypothetical protein